MFTKPGGNAARNYRGIFMKKLFPFVILAGGALTGCATSQQATAPESHDPKYNCMLPAGTPVGQGPHSLGAAMANSDDPKQLAVMVREGRVWSTTSEIRVKLDAETLDENFIAPVEDENGRKFYVVAIQLECDPSGEVE